MMILETRLKLALSSVTALWSLFTVSTSLLGKKKKCPNTHKVSRTQILCHLLFLLWVLIPYCQILAVDDFRAEVKSWAADLGAGSKEQASCPHFDVYQWRKFASRNAASVVILAVVLFTVYRKLFMNVHRSMEALYEHRSQTSVRETGHEAEIGLEKPPKKVEKKVTFQLPEPSWSIKVYSMNIIHSVAHYALPCKRQVMLALVCLGLSVFVLPKPVQHAFPMHLASFADLSITSDHAIAAVMLFSGLELARASSQGLNAPAETFNVRLAVLRFVEFYGIFLLLSTTLVWLQANDTLKLYIYKIFTPCGSAKKWHSFVDARVPNENVLSTIVGESMMKYTNSMLTDDLDLQDTTEILDNTVGIFTWVLGDCVTVLLFATLVLVPGALAYLS